MDPEDETAGNNSCDGKELGNDDVLDSENNNNNHQQQTQEPINNDSNAKEENGNNNNNNKNINKDHESNNLNDAVSSRSTRNQNESEYSNGPIDTADNTNNPFDDDTHQRLSPTSHPPNNTNNDTQPNSQNETLPLLGVRFSVLQSLFQEAISSSANSGLTTQDVCDLVVKQTTEGDKSSYVDWLLAQDSQRGDVQKANVFVSHVWRYPFALVVQMIEEYCRNKHDQSDQLYFWIDFISVNQHSSLKRPLTYYQHTLKHAIQQIGTTLVLLVTFHKPIVLSRAWCLWEMYCTITTHSRLHIILPEFQQAALINTLKKDLEFESVVKGFCEVETRKAEAFKKRDQELIFEAIREECGGAGFGVVDDVVGGAMREHFADTTQRELESNVWNNIESKELSKLLNKLGVMLKNQGKFTQAEMLYTRAIAIKQKTLGDHADTASSCNNLALLCIAQRRYEEAESLLRQVVAIREKVFGNFHPDTMHSVGTLADLVLSQGKYQAAEPLCKQALEITEKLIGNDHPDTGKWCTCIADTLIAQSKFDEAGTFARRSLASKEQLLGKEHTDTVAARYRVAEILRVQDNNVEAEELCASVLNSYEQLLGIDHTVTAAVCNSLALSLQAQGKFDEAQLYFERSILIREKLLGNEHLDTAACYNNLAVLFRAQGLYSKAETLSKRALEIREKQLNPNHPDIAVSFNNLAVLFKVQGRFAEAEELYKRAVAINEKVKGTTHPDTAASYHNLAVMLQEQFLLAQRRYANESLPLMQTALTIREHQLGTLHPVTVRTRTTLAKMTSRLTNEDSLAPDNVPVRYRKDSIVSFLAMPTPTAKAANSARCIVS